MGWIVLGGWLRMFSGVCEWFQVVSHGFGWFAVLVATLVNLNSLKVVSFKGRLPGCMTNVCFMLDS